MIRFPSGVDNFHKLVNEKYLFVDKTLFIKDILNDGAEAPLIMRPRRWGKSLNLSMLHHFLSSKVNGNETSRLFNDLKIAREKELIQEHQGKYSVIFLNFKDISGETEDAIKKSIFKVIQTAYRTFMKDAGGKEEVLKKITDDILKNDFEEILTARNVPDDFTLSLKTLTECLHSVHNKKVYILIDEYDAPGKHFQKLVDKGKISSDEASDLTECLTKVLGAATKTNQYVEKSVFTGILRLAKADAFSGLNHLSEESILDDRYAKHFGFTLEEIEDLIGKAYPNNPKNTDNKALQTWYNGYKMGGLILYNPCSIISYLQKGCRIDAYWLDTSDNYLIYQLLKSNNPKINETLVHLQLGKSVSVPIDTTSLTYKDIKENPSEIKLWSLLLLSGYLTITGPRTSQLESKGESFYTVRVPNQEIKTAYNKFGFNNLKNMLDGKIIIDDTDTLFGSLANHEIDEFIAKLRDFILKAISIRDFAQKPEAFYHGIMLAIFTVLDKTHYLFSNREAGDGYVDTALIPKESCTKAILSTEALVLEYKSLNKKEVTSEEIENTLSDALQQIEEKKYSDIALQHDQILTVKPIAMVFCGKAVHHKVGQIYNIRDNNENSSGIEPDVNEGNNSNSDQESDSNKDDYANETLTGTLPNGKKVQLHVYPTSGEGNSCGYFALPVAYDRERVAQILLEHAESEKIRGLVAPEIIDAFKSGHLTKKVLQTFYSIKKGKSKEEGLISQLYKKFKEGQNVDETLKTVAKLKNVFLSFVRTCIAGTYELSFYAIKDPELTTTLNAIAQIQNLRIYIWEKESENPKIAKCLIAIGPEDGQEHHIHHLKGKNTHFELMSVIRIDDEESEHEKSNDDKTRTNNQTMNDEVDDISKTGSNDDEQSIDNRDEGATEKFSNAQTISKFSTVLNNNKRKNPDSSPESNKRLKLISSSKYTKDSEAESRNEDRSDSKDSEAESSNEDRSDSKDLSYYPSSDDDKSYR